MATLTEFREMVGTLTTLTQEAEKAKASKSDSPDVKLARAARQVVNLTPEVFGTDVTPDADFMDKLNALSALSVDAFDRTEGEIIGTLFTKLLDVDPEYRPDAFNKVADDARKVLDAWVATKPGRRVGNGTGTGKGTPASALLSTFGINSIIAEMVSNKEGVEAKRIEHGSTFSSVSNELNKYAREATGVDKSYQEQDSNARQGWRQAIARFKDGAVGPINVVMEGEDGSRVGFSLSATRIPGWVKGETPDTTEDVDAEAEAEEDATE